MSEAPHNPKDPAFLASRALDEALDAESQRALDEALEASAELRMEADQLASVDRLVKRLGEDPVELDWNAYASLISERIAGADDEVVASNVDALVARWGATRVEMDGDGFSASVLQRINATEKRRSQRRFIFRLGAPLAAAAAVAMIVGGTFWLRSRPRAGVQVVFAPVGMMDVQSGLGHRPVAVFDRAQVEHGNGKTPILSMLAMGSSPLSADMNEMDEEAPPL